MVPHNQVFGEDLRSVQTSDLDSWKLDARAVIMRWQVDIEKR